MRFQTIRGPRRCVEPGGRPERRFFLARRRQVAGTGPRRVALSWRTEAGTNPSGRSCSVLNGVAKASCPSRTRGDLRSNRSACTSLASANKTPSRFGRQDHARHLHRGPERDRVRLHRAQERATSTPPPVGRRWVPNPSTSRHQLILVDQSTKPVRASQPRRIWRLTRTGGRS